MAIKLKSSAMFGGQGTADWYRKDNEALAGVTNAPKNEALGLLDIRHYAPTDAQSEKGMVCSVILETIIGTVRGTVYESKKAPDTLYWTPPQSSQENEETGETKYYDEVKLTSKLQAQVLRYVETLVDFTDADTAVHTDAGNPFANVGQPQGQAGNPFANTGAVGAPAGQAGNPFAGAQPQGQQGNVGQPITNNMNGANPASYVTGNADPAQYVNPQGANPQTYVAPQGQGVPQGQQADPFASVAVTQPAGQ